MKRNKNLTLILLSMLCLVGCTKYSGKSTSTTDTSTNTNNNNNNTGGTGSSGNSGTGTIIITYTSSSACAPSNEKFTFSCNGTGVPVNAIFEWYFGDGNNATGNPINYAYTDAGYKTVLVKIKKDGAIIGEQTVSIKAYGQNVTPIAAITYTATTQIGTQATYDFQSAGTVSGAATYKWDFGDGGFGNDSKTTHTFQQKTYNQTFNIKLLITSDAGCNDTKTIQLIVPAAYDITGGFTFTATSPCLPSTEEFTFKGPTTNVPSGAIYAWDFGDGSGQTLGNPVKKSYAYHNTYNVVLNIIYNGKVIYTSSQPIKSFGIDANPKPSFSVQNTASTATTTTYFCNNSSQAIGGYSNIKFDWDFGDGTTTSTTNFTAEKVYNRDVIDKTYIIKMVVTSNSGCTASNTSTVTIPKK